MRNKEHAYSDQFKMVNITRANPVAAYDLWAAIWSNRGRGHVVIAAPTLDELRDRWEQIANCDFDPTIAQHMVIAQWRKGDAEKKHE